MASKKVSASSNGKQFSMMNFVTRTQSTSEAPLNVQTSGKKSKFVWKSKATSSPCVKETAPVELGGASTARTDLDVRSKPRESFIGRNGLFASNNTSGIDPDVFSAMEVDDNLSEINLSPHQCNATPSKKSTSRRISDTPSPSKIKTASPIKESRTLRTPVKTPSKSDSDPLRDLKLDSSISGFLEKMSNHPALRDAQKAETSDIEDCRSKYIELLEKISDAFDRIPLCIKEKFPGFDNRTYTKVKHLKFKFKNVLKINSKKKVNAVDSSSSKCLLNDGGRTSPSLLEDLEEFDLSSSQVYGKKLPVNNLRHSAISSDTETASTEQSTFDFSKKSLPLKTIYSNNITEKSLDVFCSSIDNSKTLDNERSRKSEELNVSENQNRTKGKFVFKKPSRLTLDDPTDKSTPLKDVPSSTLERLKTASNRLKPLQEPEVIKYTPINNSSVEFQPPQLSKSSLMGFNKPCTIVSPIVKNGTPTDSDFGDTDNEYEVPIDLDDDFDITYPESSKVSVINISDSLPSTSVNRSNLDSALEKDIKIDNDGWPVYNIEDFEDDFEPETSSKPEQEVINLMEHSFGGDRGQSEKKYEGMGDFHAGTKNDGVTGEFDGFDYPHSSLMMEMFKEKFGLKSFRPNQLQVINATLLGLDCFVLMPTGGGKSLCYQLPAILTPGVTIVISPLKSLILDQVNKLLSLDIPAAHLSGDVSLAAVDEIYHKLSMREPLLKLLYVTPEKISSSAKFQTMLDTLYTRDKVARFVIDEAHCVSQWGHDFRPDYKKLHILRERFPNTTIMALTATANPRVRMDILHQLKVKSCKWFLCSFNRPNLVYRILEKKPKSINQDVAKLIKEEFRRDSGIVYCLSRKECENLAGELKRAGICAAAYHAGLSDKQREIVQSSWVVDKFKVICATIAFGMGVDKADVRFVIHHSMPKSVEGYYQEAGRAGRDGDLATCLLFYSYSDVIRYRRLVDMERTASAESKRVHVENLLRMVEVCESITECRRAQVLSYLGERFAREQCIRDKRTACDNCTRSQDFKPVDVTEECKLIAKCVRDATSGGRAPYTLIHIADALKGSMQARLASLQKSPIHGKCKSWQRSDPLRLLRQMVVRGLLSEKLVVNNDIASAYIVLGPNVQKLMNDGLRVVFPMKSAQKKTSLITTSAPTTQDTPINEEIKRLEERCYADLVEACREMGAARGASLAAVMPLAALKAMATRLPETADDMLALPHVTRANYVKYGAGLLKITAQYATEKLGLLMQYQDEMEVQETEGDMEQDGHQSDTDWAALGANSSTSSSQRGRKRSFRRGGVRKKYKRGGGKGKAASATRVKAARGAMRGRGASYAATHAQSGGWKSAAGLGSMPLPRANTSALTARPGVMNPASRLKLL